LVRRNRVRGLIGWFASNHVAANLLVVFIVALGAYSISIVKKESFPDFQFDVINVQVPYPGAGPEEVEEGIVVKIEEALTNVEGVRELTGLAYEGSGQVRLEVKQGYEISEVMDEVKLAVDGISQFPGDAERPIISKSTRKKGALTVQVSGPLDEATMKALTETIRDEIVALPDVTYAELWGGRPFEIAIEIDELTLRQYGLTLQQVAGAIRNWSVDIPGGSIRTQSGDIRLRAIGQAYTGDDFARIVLLTRPSGTVVTLGDVANIKDGFAEVETLALFNGKPSLGINVQSAENESEIRISEAVNRYVDERNETLPDGIELAVWGDSTYYLQGRIDMLLDNMMLGAVLVFLILGLFLHIKLASWVLVGLPVAFLGAFMMLPVVDVTINIMSLFAFILVLGIVVDDAIIIAESAYTETELKGYNTANIVAGAQKVAVPATFGVLTTIMAFLPLLFVTGPTSTVNAAIAWVVILCLVFSLVESKLILPSHLALMKSSHAGKARFPHWVDSHLQRFIEKGYKPFLVKAIEYRYATLAVFIGLLILTTGLFGGGLVRFIFFPDFEMDFLNARMEVIDGAPETMALQIVREMETALREVNDEIKAEKGSEADVVKNVYAYVQNGQVGRFQVELEKGEYREVSPTEVELRWRDKVGEIAGTKELRFMSKENMGGGAPIAVKLQGRNYLLVEQAAEELAEHLRDYEGLYEIETSMTAGPEEIKLRIKPGAESLGITLVDLARQVREAFYGAEAQRIQRSNQEIRVMVRYPREQRRSVGNLESMWIKLPDGRELPFSEVAEYEMSPGFSFIRRVDGRRSISISANADVSRIQPSAVLSDLRLNFIPDLLSRYPGVNLELDGSSQEEQSSIAQVGSAFLIALLGIYALMAIPLKSYLQPLIIMSVIPFGIIGAVFGHMLLGMTINAISLIGFIALAGVVVNDSLIMVDFVNKKILQGVTPSMAAIEAGAERFRAILLTSLTTFFGLVPILSEQSMQAQMVIPMAVSLAFGILFATVITLIFVPCLYNILGDIVGFKKARLAHA
jgi:multidrug efflux pump subunit AcrB